MSLKARIEATLFVKGKPLKLNELSQMLKAPIEEIEQSMLDLIMDYSSRESALEIDDEDGYAIQVKEEYHDIVEALLPIEMNENVLKTLSFIAIKQPVLQSLVVNTRGIKAYDHINQLLQEELITKTPKGKSFWIKTTHKFIEYFKISGNTQELVKLLEKQTKN